jgi:hypothetical protein
VRLYPFVQSQHTKGVAGQHKQNGVQHLVKLKKEGSSWATFPKNSCFTERTRKGQKGEVKLYNCTTIL